MAPSPITSARLVPGGSQKFPRTFNTQFHKVQEMRYGENPHQQAAFYVEANPAEAGIATARQIQGKELSYNNVADTDAALECVKNFQRTGLRHRQTRQSLRRGGGRQISAEAYDLAFATDTESAFGGIIAFNRELDAATAAAHRGAAICRSHHRPQRERRGRRAGGRQEKRAPAGAAASGPRRGPALDYKRVNGGLLVQDRDLGMITRDDLRVVSKRAAHRTAATGPVVCLESGEVRQIQRHRLRRQRPHRRASAPGR